MLVFIYTAFYKKCMFWEKTFNCPPYVEFCRVPLKNVIVQGLSNLVLSTYNIWKKDTLSIINTHMCSNILKPVFVNSQKSLNKENDAYVQAQCQNEIWWTRTKLVTKNSIKANDLPAAEFSEFATGLQQWNKEKLQLI